MKFNGHKNWGHWNVSLWINNDEWLYSEALRLCSNCNRAEASEKMLEWLHDMGIYETPDGAKYSVSSIRAAMVGIN